MSGDSNQRPKCAECGGEISSDGWVNLNGLDLHVVTCFAKGLRRLANVRAGLEIELSPTMPPVVAYKAGQSSVGTIVAARRRAKRKAPF